MTEQTTMLHRLRHSHGLSLESIADRIRFPKQSLKRMESGNYPLDRMIQAPDEAHSIERRLQAALGTFMPLSQLLEP